MLPPMAFEWPRVSIFFRAKGNLLKTTGNTQFQKEVPKSRPSFPYSLPADLEAPGARAATHPAGRRGPPPAPASARRRAGAGGRRSWVL